MIYTICDNCKKPTYVRNLNNKHNFCCRSCYDEYRKINNITGKTKKEFNKCKECDNQVISTNLNKVFCSMQCRNSYCRKYICKNCNIEFYSIYSVREMKKKHKTIPSYCSDSCCNENKYKNEETRRNKISLAFSGEKHPLYKHGKIKRRYSTDKKSWAKISEEIRQRDNYQCQGCLIDQSELSYKLHVHHIKPYVNCDSIEEANNSSNLISLCVGCHTTADHVAAKKYPKLGLLGLKIYEDSEEKFNNTRRTCNSL